jgi:hypothetical protein
MRAKYKINNTQLEIGPTNIIDASPEGGQFKPSRGRPIIFPGVYQTVSGKIINREERWVWDLVIENESVFTFLNGISYSGDIVTLSTKFGEHISTWETYSGELVDCSFEMHDGLIFNGDARGYRCTLIINCFD